jgi:hypothetical protein
MPVSIQDLLRVTELDGSPSVSAQVLKFPNGTVTDNGDGSATYTPAASGQTLFEAVVAASGGDYTTLGAALNAGKKRIFVRQGTYTETGEYEIAADTVIVGESRENTIIDITGTTNRRQKINASVNDVQISNLTFYSSVETDYVLDQGGGASDSAYRFRLENCRLTGGGVRINGSSAEFTDDISILDNAISINATGGGSAIYINGSTSNSSAGKVRIVGNSLTAASGSTPTTPLVYVNGAMRRHGEFSGNKCSADGTNSSCDWIYLYDDGGNDYHGWNITGNSFKGFSVSGTYSLITVRNSAFVGNTLLSCGRVATSDVYAVVTGNKFRATLAYLNGGAFVGNSFSRTGADITFAATVSYFTVVVGNVANGTGQSIGITEPTTMEKVLLADNHGFRGGSLTNSREIAAVYNASGSTIGAGEVVTLDAQADCSKVTRTTTNGDSKVYGMAIASINNGSTEGWVLRRGKTKVLKVNGTTDIAIGDWLTTYTEAGIACKAVAGQTVFAVALEAYTGNDSNGVIDAYLVTPFSLPIGIAATAAECDTGTATDRVVTPDALAGSVHGKKVFEITDHAYTTDLAVADGRLYFRVPAECNGMNLVGCFARVLTAGVTGTTDIQIRNVTDAVDVLSTKMTVDSEEVDTATAATPAVIDATHDDMATGDLLAIDIDAVSTTAPKGLIIGLVFQLP